jgi:CheY-like chemotaxis protein
VQTILAVDDELGAIEVVATALEDEGYRVLSAANGRHGLEKLAEGLAHHGQVDLAVIDFMMPLLDGAAMGRAMKENPAFRKIPIIMMSAVGEPLVRERFDGYTAFLRKQFRISALIDTVRKVLAG